MVQSNKYENTSYVNNIYQKVKHIRLIHIHLYYFSASISIKLYENLYSCVLVLFIFIYLLFLSIHVVS